MISSLNNSLKLINANILDILFLKAKFLWGKTDHVIKSLKIYPQSLALKLRNHSSQKSSGLWPLQEIEMVQKLPIHWNEPPQSLVTGVTTEATKLS